MDYEQVSVGDIFKLTYRKGKYVKCSLVGGGIRHVDFRKVKQKLST